MDYLEPTLREHRRLTALLVPWLDGWRPECPGMPDGIALWLDVLGRAYMS